MRIPICFFSSYEFGMKPSSFCAQLKPAFKTLSTDYYDVRRKKIEILQQSPVKLPVSVLKEYYEGIKDDTYLADSYLALPGSLRKEYLAVRPYRYRAISTFNITFEGDTPKIKRLFTPPFVQEKALISDDTVDFRKWNRTFKELSVEAGEIPAFQLALSTIATRIHSLCDEIIGLNITAHHVRVKTLPDSITSNSPEGLHQDGFPFIVSALVVERENVTGGVSEIYAEDKNTVICKTVLQPGYGILQPDLGSPLWHLVTPISGKGHRSTLGFDIDPIIRK